MKAQSRPNPDAMAAADALPQLRQLAAARTAALDAGRVDEYLAATSRLEQVLDRMSPTQLRSAVTLLLVAGSRG